MNEAGFSSIYFTKLTSIVYTRPRKVIGVLCDCDVRCWTALNVVRNKKNSIGCMWDVDNL